MTKKPFVILGAGGHGRVVAEALRSGGYELTAFLDSDRSLWGTKIGGVAVAGGDEKLPDFPETRFSLALGVGAARNTNARQRLHALAAKAHRSLPPIVAASAFVAASARLGAGTQVLTRAVVHPGASIGDGTVINTAAIVEHDCRLGEHVFVGPAAVLCGAVAVGPRAFIGAGAVILPGVRVGAGALVAAGVTVRSDVADGKRALGRDRSARA